MPKPLTRQQTKGDAEDANMFRWLMTLPPIKAQAYFWNYSSRTERRKAMRRDYIAATRSAR